MQWLGGGQVESGPILGVCAPQELCTVCKVPWTVCTESTYCKSPSTTDTQSYEANDIVINGIYITWNKKDLKEKHKKREGVLCAPEAQKRFPEQSIRGYKGRSHAQSTLGNMCGVFRSYGEKDCKVLQCSHITVMQCSVVFGNMCNILVIQEFGEGGAQVVTRIQSTQFNCNTLRAPTDRILGYIRQSNGTILGYNLNT